MKLQGVVLGIDSYEEGAVLAAARNQDMTGIPFAVIQERPPQLKPADFPGYAKLFLFENFDADVIVYLDTDIVLLQEWDTRELVERQELVAVRDQFIAEYPHWDPEINRARYFNGGLFIVNRVNHAELFDLAVSIWRDGEIPLALSDQSALNHAVRLSGAPVHLIHERYNYLRYHLRPEASLSDVVGAHFTPHGYQLALAKLSELDAGGMAPG